MQPRHLSVALMITAGLSVWQVTAIPDSPMYAVVGAELIPAIVSGLIAVLSLCYAVIAFRGGAFDSENDSDQRSLSKAGQRFGFFVGGCALFAILIKPAGFLISGTLASLGIARSFDAPLNMRSVIYCAIITAVFWVLFALLLTVDVGPLVAGL